MSRRQELTTALQWQRLERLVDHDFADPSLRAAVAEGRGLGFRRLEFLGDPVLELAVAVGLHRAGVAGNEAAGSQLARMVARRTSTDGLSNLTLAGQLRALLGGTRGRRRRADVVEAVAGALFVDGGWPAADRFAARCGLVPDEVPGPADGQPEQGGQDDPDTARVVGGLVIDTAFAWWAYRTMPDRDEGVLTAMVHERTGNHRLATLANRVGLASASHPENLLRARVGADAVHRGRGAALAMVSELANLGLPADGATGPAGAGGHPGA